MIQYKINYTNGETEQTKINLLNGSVEDVSSGLYGMWTDFKESEFEIKYFQIRFAHNRCYTDLDLSDFKKLGEMLRSRDDYKQVKEYCVSEFADTVHGKEFLNLVFGIDEL